MDDTATARRLAAVAPGLNPAPEPAAGPEPAPDPAGPALRDGEFLLAVKDPPRLVPHGLLVRGRVPQAGGGPAAAPRRAWEGA